MTQEDRPVQGRRRAMNSECPLAKHVSDSSQEQQDQEGKLERPMCSSFAENQSLDGTDLGLHHRNVTQREGRGVKSFLVPHSCGLGSPVATGVRRRDRPGALGNNSERPCRGLESPCSGQPSPQCRQDGICPLGRPGALSSRCHVLK